MVSAIEYEPTSLMSRSGMCCERPSTMSPSRYRIASLLRAPNVDRRARLVLVLLVRDVVADELLGRPLELVVEREPVDKPGLARLGRDERPVARHVAHALLARGAGRATGCARRPTSICRSMSRWSARGDRAGVLVGELLRGRLVRTDADEVRLDADLVEQPLQVDVLRLEARVAHAARRGDDDAVRAGARVERLGARVLQRAEDLLAVRPEHADGVGELLGVGERARGLGAEDERHGVDVRASASFQSLRRSATWPRVAGVLSRRIQTACDGQGDARLRVRRRSPP